MRLLADETVDRGLVAWLRNQGHDVIEITSDRPGVDDPEVIRHSRASNRILLTFDRDIGHLLLDDGRSHPGVVYLRLWGSKPEVFRRFKEVWPSIPPLVEQHFVTVDGKKIRRRPLPL